MTRKSASTWPPVGGFNIGIKVTYDYQLRNSGWDEGVLWTGLNLSIRF